MTDADLIAFLWRTGHFWHPAQPDGHNVDERSLELLTTADRVVRDAVRSFQAADENVNLVSVSMHGRPAVVDGDAGPATRQVARFPRCPVPDHAPPPGVRSADPTLDAILQSYQHWAAAGTGSWPASGCDPERRGVHSIRVAIDLARCPSAVRSYLDRSLAACVAAYAEVGLHVRYVHQGAGEIVKKFEPLPGGTIGWNYFPRPNTCSQITGRLDTGYAPGDYRFWANLECHETGHGVGLEHTRGSIMNPSILLVWPLTWRGTPSESALRRYFGGTPVVPPAPPPPPPPDPPPVAGLRLPLPGGGFLTADYATKTITYPAGWTGRIA